jgi:3-hydroxybutyryl-CoA dehydratase
MEPESMGELLVGRKVQFAKTVGESDVYLFAGITGDLDPNHVDEEYCKRQPWGRRIAHGALIVGYMSTTSTLIMHGVDRPALSLGYDRIRFLKPVFIGDTLTVDYEIEGFDEERLRTTARVEVHNQGGALVAVATHIQKLF